MFRIAKIAVSSLRIALGLSLMAAVVVQSARVSATHMQCNTSGKSKVYLVSKKGCCPHFPVPENSIDLRCCDYELYSAQFYQFKDGSGNFTIKPVSVTAAVIAHLPQKATAADKRYFLPHQKAPPPLSGNDILHRICKYTI